MESTSAGDTDLTVSNRDLNEPKIVKAILGVVGSLLVLVGGYLFGTAETQLNAEIERSIEMSLAEFRQLPEEVWSVVESVRQNELARRRGAFGAVLGAGCVLLLFALVVKRRLLAMVIASLIVVLAGTGVFAVLARKRELEGDSGMDSPVAEMHVEKIIVWVAIGFSLASLAWAAKIAIAFRQRMRAALPADER